MAIKIIQKAQSNDNSGQEWTGIPVEIDYAESDEKLTHTANQISKIWFPTGVAEAPVHCIL